MFRIIRVSAIVTVSATVSMLPWADDGLNSESTGVQVERLSQLEGKWELQLAMTLST